MKEAGEKLSLKATSSMRWEGGGERERERDNIDVLLTDFKVKVRVSLLQSIPHHVGLLQGQLHHKQYSTKVS